MIRVESHNGITKVEARGNPYILADDMARVVRIFLTTVSDGKSERQRENIREDLLRRVNNALEESTYYAGV